MGAGPAGLSYADLVAGDNAVTVFERARRAGGAFNLAAKAPRFQEVEAAEGPIRAFIEGLERACRDQGVAFRFGVDAAEDPEVLAPFDRVVFATGARYRYGLGALVPALLAAGWGHSRLARRIFASQGVRDWFYARARRGRAAQGLRPARAGQKVLAIGDAAVPAKGKQAIESAFRAALFDPPAGA
ncbi:MAG: hypothetical protein IH924_08195 [Proteobacteria bacterium]|nr:hypothetical protein [Pseudomonadota bacterium]